MLQKLRNLKKKIELQSLSGFFACIFLLFSSPFLEGDVKVGVDDNNQNTCCQDKRVFALVALSLLMNDEAANHLPFASLEHCFLTYYLIFKNVIIEFLI